jgi:hypothetical protein
MYKQNSTLIQRHGNTVLQLQNTGMRIFPRVR